MDLVLRRDMRAVVMIEQFHSELPGRQGVTKTPLSNKRKSDTPGKDRISGRTSILPWGLLGWVLELPLIIGPWRLCLGWPMSELGPVSTPADLVLQSERSCSFLSLVVRNGQIPAHGCLVLNSSPGRRSKEAWITGKCLLVSSALQVKCCEAWGVEQGGHWTILSSFSPG